MHIIKIRLQKSQNGKKIRSPQNMAWVSEKYCTAKCREWGEWAVCSMFYDDTSTQWESRIHFTTLKKWGFPKSGIVASVRPLTACISLSRDVWFGHLLVWEMRPLKMQLHATAQLTPNTQIHRYKIQIQKYTIWPPVCLRYATVQDTSERQWTLHCEIFCAHCLTMCNV